MEKKKKKLQHSSLLQSYFTIMVFIYLLKIVIYTTKLSHTSIVVAESDISFT